MPPNPDPTPSAFLTATDVSTVLANVAQSVDAPLVIAVTDRSGKVLAVFHNASSPATGIGNFGNTVDSKELAVALARTAALFSNNQAPLSSRTVRFISGIHFPPGIANTPSADLYGIETTNRGCDLDSTLPSLGFSPARLLDGVTPGLGIITGKANLLDDDPNAVNPGGVPLFKNGLLVGGVGAVSTRDDVAEFAAFAGATASGFLPSVAQLPPPGVVVIGGISLPFVNQTTLPAGLTAGNATGTYDIGPFAGALPPEGTLIASRDGVGLTKAEVTSIINNAVAEANLTRAVIRLPQGSRTRMSIAVSDLDGTMLGLYRMADGTVFSLDVAATKARNVIWFSQQGYVDLPGVPLGTAVTNRTISFGAQPLFPSGIDGSSPGPFYNLFVSDTANPCTQGSGNLPHQSGIVFFPGSLPLYKNGVLVGGLGVSGDGVDQDDFVTSAGAKGFEAAAAIRADQVTIREVRLPYLKFPRNPTD